MTAKIFSRPDYTVGTGIEPVQLSLAGYTAGGELHPALKTQYLVVSLSYHLYCTLSSIAFCAMMPLGRDFTLFKTLDHPGGGCIGDVTANDAVVADEQGGVHRLGGAGVVFDLVHIAHHGFSLIVT